MVSLLATPLTTVNITSLLFRNNNENFNALLTKARLVCEELSQALGYALGVDDPVALSVKEKIKLHEAMIESSNAVCKSNTA